MMQNVLLQDQTVGTIDVPAKVGAKVTVWLHDENGCRILVVGVIEEILD
jgi:hypothetical protein